MSATMLMTVQKNETVMQKVETTSKIHIPHLFQPSSTSLPVIDPMLKHFGRVWINMKYVEHTGAVRRWICRDSHQPSLCMLFQRGRCSAGTKCNQAHVNVQHMEDVRHLLLSIPFSNCCFEHGDLASRREAFRVTVKRHPIELKRMGQLIPVPANCIAVTAFWDRFIKAEKTKASQDPERVIRFPWQRVCRLHQSDGCRYGVDCNNVHLCREFFAQRDLGSSAGSESDECPSSDEWAPMTPPSSGDEATSPTTFGSPISPNAFQQCTNAPLHAHPKAASPPTRHGFQPGSAAPGRQAFGSYVQLELPPALPKSQPPYATPVAPTFPIRPPTSPLSKEAPTPTPTRTPAGQTLPPQEATRLTESLQQIIPALLALPPEGVEALTQMLKQLPGAKVPPSPLQPSAIPPTKAAPPTPPLSGPMMGLPLGKGFGLQHPGVIAPPAPKLPTPQKSLSPAFEEWTGYEGLLIQEALLSHHMQDILPIGFLGDLDDFHGPSGLLPQ
eukprot:EG_transcript_3829